MAAIVQTTVSNVNAPVNVTVTTLSASDTLTYASGSKQILSLYNTTASPIVVTITGDDSTTISPSGYGGTIDVSTGKVITVPANGQTVVNLDVISVFLSGDITVTGGVGIDAALYI